MRLAPIPHIAVVLLAALQVEAAQHVFQARIDVVGFAVSVVDRNGRSVGELKAEDFEIREDGVPQTLSYFSLGADEGGVPLHIGLLFDTSESMERDLSFSRSAAIKFLTEFNDAADFSIVDFDTEVRAARFTQAEFPRLVERIRSRPAKGLTALYDALGVYLGGAFDQTGRKVLVLYTDGGDTSSSRSWSDTVRVLKASDVTVFPIGFMGHLGSAGAFVQRGRLTQIAETTGGVAFFPSAMKELDAMYARIATAIRTQYLLGYVSTNTRRDGAWHKVTVKLARPDLSRTVVRAREGYFAPAK
jgi:Ca-activated chloride channel family protein